ncbi:MAG: hypothetical protein ACRCS4_00705 [Flavobacterium sp.]
MRHWEEGHCYDEHEDELYPYDERGCLRECLEYDEKDNCFDIANEILKELEFVRDMMHATDNGMKLIIENIIKKI